MKLLLAIVVVANMALIVLGGKQKGAESDNSQPHHQHHHHPLHQHFLHTRPPVTEGITIPVPITQPPVTETNQDLSKINHHEIISKIREGTYRITAIGFKQNPNKAKSLSIIPFYLYLCHLGLYANEPILKEIYMTLNLHSRSELLYTLRLFHAEYNKHTLDITSKVVVKYFTNVIKPFSSDFKIYLYKLLKGVTDNLVYSNPDDAAQQINTWIQQQSHTEYEVINPNDIVSSDGLVIAGSFSVAVSLKNFKFGGSVMIDFYCSNTVVVKRKAEFGYGLALYTYDVDNNFEIIQINAKGGIRILLIDLIDKESNVHLDDILTCFQDVEYRNNILSGLKPIYLEAVIPFNGTYSQIHNYVKDLKKANEVTSIFDPHIAGLEGVHANGQSGFVSHMLAHERLTIKDLLVSRDVSASPNFSSKCPEGYVHKRKVFNAPHFMILLNTDSIPIYSYRNYGC